MLRTTKYTLRGDRGWCWEAFLLFGAKFKDKEGGLAQFLRMKRPSLQSSSMPPQHSLGLASRIISASPT